MSTTLPPVIAGPMLLNESPESEMFFNESGSELFCAVVNDEKRNKKLKMILANKFFIVKTLDLLKERLLEWF